VAGDHFALGRFEQAEHRQAYLLFDLVDDRVQADVHAFVLGDLAGARLGPHVEADDDRRPATKNMSAIALAAAFSRVGCGGGGDEGSRISWRITRVQIRALKPP